MAEMRALAGRLTAAFQEDPSNAGLARELRLTLLALETAPGPAVWDEIDQLRLEEAQSRYREQGN